MPVLPLRAVFIMKQSLSLLLIAKMFGGRKEEKGCRKLLISVTELRLLTANFV